MIFVTVGTQLPFDRLVRAVDDWAATHPGHNIFAQIGPSRYRPRHMRWAHAVESEQCRYWTSIADAVVAHAGMGSIITALELGKPIIVMPRRGDLGEHRNDHQLATAHHLQTQRGITVAHDETELADVLDRVQELGATRAIPTRAQPQLLEALSAFMDWGIGPQTAELPAWRRPELAPSAQA